MDKRERLLKLIKHYSDGKPTIFARHIGVSPSTISAWLSRNTIGYDLVYGKCENLSAHWLLTGEGSMLNENPIHTNTIIDSTDLHECYNKPMMNNVELNLTDTFKHLTDIIRDQSLEIGRLRERLLH